MVRRNDYQPIFPWFGGKSPVADTVWSRLGDVANYVEPFFGSGAVLMLRPQIGHTETVNDADGFVANFWRALQNDSDSVAFYADNPVNEADLHARHLWLIGQRERITDRLCGDPEFYDAKAAGWWAWGQCCWIGSGWCSGRGPWQSIDGEMALRNPGQGVNRQLPHLGDPGKGVETATTALGQPGPGCEPETPGIYRKRPNISGHHGGVGVNRPVESADNNSKRSEWLRKYLSDFASRLRHVRVCCGDWSRVCGPSVTFRHGMTGVFLDPPYANTADRTENLYATDCERVAHDVRVWAIEQGRNPLMRICLAGYAGEHEMPADWSVEEWEAVGGYGLIADEEDSRGRANKKKERLWFSPACLRKERMKQRSLIG